MSPPKGEQEMVQQAAAAEPSLIDSEMDFADIYILVIFILKNLVLFSNLSFFPLA